ncbi:hypothetical protein Taro_021097 [Colocasia esculenta]|uniref:Uncharacterized protein n=1 Tax=Colocasia esculenta TaxID=4460 RepID=A0A843UY39_COLES|nr:hypothetical protein [Colocasia esculenta]
MFSQNGSWRFGCGAFDRVFSCGAGQVVFLFIFGFPGCASGTSCVPRIGSVVVVRLAVPPVGVLALRGCSLFRVRRRPVVCLLPLLFVGCSGWWCFHMAFGAMSRTVATFVAKVSCGEPFLLACVVSAFGATVLHFCLVLVLAVAPCARARVVCSVLSGALVHCVMPWVAPGASVSTVCCAVCMIVALSVVHQVLASALWTIHFAVPPSDCGVLRWLTKLGIPRGIPTSSNCTDMIVTGWNEKLIKKARKTWAKYTVSRKVGLAVQENREDIWNPNNMPMKTRGKRTVLCTRCQLGEKEEDVVMAGDMAEEEEAGPSVAGAGGDSEPEGEGSAGDDGGDEMEAEAPRRPKGKGRMRSRVTWDLCWAWYRALPEAQQTQIARMGFGHLLTFVAGRRRPIRGILLGSLSEAVGLRGRRRGPLETLEEFYTGVRGTLDLGDRSEERSVRIFVAYLFGQLLFATQSSQMNCKFMLFLRDLA